MTTKFPETVLSELPEARRLRYLDHWRRNMAIVETLHPGLAAEISSLPDDCGIRATLSGDDLVMHSVTPDGARFLLTGTAQSRARAAKLADLPDNQFYLLAGVGLGAELRALYELTREPEPMLPNWRIGLYIIEPEIAFLALLLLLNDWADVLRDERVRWFCGRDALQRYADFVFSSDQVVAAKMMLPLSFGAEREQLVAGITEIDDLSARCHRENLEQLTVELEDYYANEGRRCLQAALRGERPLRVLGLTSRFTSFLQYCMRDLLWGFERHGAVTWLFIEPSDIHRPHSLAIAQAVAKCRPDLVIVIDHYRDEFPYLPTDLPFVNWIQDLLPGIVEPCWESLSSSELVYVFSDGFKRTLQAMPKYRGLDLPVLPVGCNPELYRPLHDVDELFDVCYVTHLLDPKLTFEGLCSDGVEFELTEPEANLVSAGHYTEADLVALYRALGEALRRLPLDQLGRLFQGGEPLLSLFSWAGEHAGIAVSEPLHEYFKCSDSRFTRDIVLQSKARPAVALARAGFDLRCYGRNWDLLPETRETAHGEVENGEALNRLMNQARICLHCTGTGYHMRSVEIMAAGRFMLCREVDGDLMPIDGLFTPGVEVVTFRTEPELVDLARRYVADRPTRDRIAGRARERLLANHGYDRVAGRIVADIAERMKEETPAVVGG